MRCSIALALDSPIWIARMRALFISCSIELIWVCRSLRSLPAAYFHECATLVMRWRPRSNLRLFEVTVAVVSLARKSALQRLMAAEDAAWAFLRLPLRPANFLFCLNWASDRAPYSALVDLERSRAACRRRVAAWLRILARSCLVLFLRTCTSFTATAFIRATTWRNPPRHLRAEACLPAASLTMRPISALTRRLMRIC